MVRGRFSAIILGFAAILLFPVCSYAQQAEMRVIEVNASARMNVAPNKIEVQISLTQTPTKGKVGIDELERQVVDAMSGCGLDVKKNPSLLKVVSQSSDYDRKTSVFQFKTLMATLSSQEQAAELFSRLSDVGIAGTRIVNVTHTDMDSLRLKVKEMAMVNARNTAQGVAGAVGQKIGKAVSITVNNYNGGYYGGPVMLARSNDAAMAKGDVTLQSAADSAPALEFRDLEIEQSVSAKFVLE